MSVKNKVKKCNKEIKKLQEELETYKLSNIRLREKLYSQVDNEVLENILKFAITNHIGGLRGGMMIDYFGTDKMRGLRLNIERVDVEHAYLIRVG